MSDQPLEPFDPAGVALGPGSADSGSIDSVLAEVLAQVDDVLQEQVRLRLLVDAVISMNADLSLDSVLSGMAETAARLVDAKQAAIAVFTPGPEWRLRTFVHRGMTEDETEALAGLSGETGLLDHLLESGSAVRLADLLERADAAGVPRDRVPVDSFLGVPVRTRTEVFGVLYLAGRLADGDFTEQDETLMVALATAAGVAIDNARLHTQSTARQDWLTATAEAVTLLATTDLARAMPTVTRAARSASGADLAWVATGRDVGSTRLHALVGEHSGVLGQLDDHDLGTLDLGESLMAEVFRTGEPVLVDDLATDERVTATVVEAIPFGRAVVVPLRSGDGIEGVLGLGWNHDRNTLDDLAAPTLGLIEGFATQVALAVRATRAREDNQRLALLADRGRIGSDLHGRVIQRLFGVGLGLEAAARLTDRPAVSQRLEDAVAELDTAIADLRRSIFDLGAREPSNEDPTAG